ncbi:MAG: hypothetical protein ABI353_03795 [Isosphaeraceae bacterium]
MTDADPGRRPWTIQRFMLDAAIMAFAVLGVISPQNPIIATLAFSAICYFAARFWLAVGPNLMARLFPGTPDPDLEDDDPDEGIHWRDDPRE